MPLAWGLVVECLWPCTAGYTAPLKSQLITGSSAQNVLSAMLECRLTIINVLLKPILRNDRITHFFCIKSVQLHFILLMMQQMLTPLVLLYTTSEWLVSVVVTHWRGQK